MKQRSVVLYNNDQIISMSPASPRIKKPKENTLENITYKLIFLLKALPRGETSRDNQDQFSQARIISLLVPWT